MLTEETKSDSTSPATDSVSSNRECWICYETEQGAPEAGPMIGTHVILKRLYTYDRYSCYIQEVI